MINGPDHDPIGPDPDGIQDAKRRVFEALAKEDLDAIEETRRDYLEKRAARWPAITAARLFKRDRQWYVVVYDKETPLTLIPGDASPSDAMLAACARLVANGNYPDWPSWRPDGNAWVVDII